MEDAEHELYKLGIPVKTRHNEVAPSQFELAPIFEDVNISADHNTLTMEVLKRIALRHGLVCLLHEKPFAGINGSGKHNNWSMSNDKGENLLEPGTTPHQNLRFLAVLSVVLKAVHDHADVLRSSIATPGNDHRLGANEAPPAIISVFLGSLLSQILDSIEAGKVAAATEGSIIDLGVGKIPNISKDYTDRNRTSPFAFTGNKFEFRAVGSSANVAVPMAVLNAAVAEAFNEATQKLRKLLAQKANRDEAVIEMIKGFVKETKAVRFEGNGYSEEWKIEAKKRGLPILSTSAEALEVLRNEKATAFLVKQKVLSGDEIAARYHISVERYVKTLEIEMYTLSELVTTHVIPAIEKQVMSLYSVHGSLSGASVKKVHGDRVKLMESVFEEVLGGLDKLNETMESIHGKSDETAKMKALSTMASEASGLLRSAADRAERLVADEFWPLPKYREMLFANTLS